MSKRNKKNQAAQRSGRDPARGSRQAEPPDPHIADDPPEAAQNGAPEERVEHPTGGSGELSLTPLESATYW